jgi:hypothetical protein
MAKRALKLHFLIPPYRIPRNGWRRLIHSAATEAQRRAGVTYTDTDRLEVEVRLYLDGSALDWHDVDNRLKDVLDALQGRAGGSEAIRSLSPLIPNDRQIYRVVIEKCAPPEQSRGLGHVTIRRLRNQMRLIAARPTPR